MPNDFADRSGYDRGRLLRAGVYIEKGHVEQKGSGEFEIKSRKGSRFVNLNIDQPCDCEDCFYRGVRIRNNCKHTLCARMMSGDTALLIAWGIELVKRAERNEQVAHTRTRRRKGANG